MKEHGYMSTRTAGTHLPLRLDAGFEEVEADVGPAGGRVEGAGRLGVVEQAPEVLHAGKGEHGPQRGAKVGHGLRL